MSKHQLLKAGPNEQPIETSQLDNAMRAADNIISADDSKWQYRDIAGRAALSGDDDIARLALTRIRARDMQLQAMSTMVREWAKRGETAKALKLAGEMPREGEQNSEYGSVSNALSTILRARAKRADVEGATQALKALEELGDPSNLAYSYVALLGALTGTIELAKDED